MNDDVARQLIQTVLHQVAPEADLDAVGTDETLQEALDLDSLDFLNFVVGLHQATGVDVPERDYPQLATMEGCVAYLRARHGTGDGDGDGGGARSPGSATASGEDGDRASNGRTTWTSS